MSDVLFPALTDYLWWYRARPLRVVDGDTMIVEVDLGMRNFTHQSLRLIGVDTPELFSGTAEERELGAAARQFVVDWLDARDGEWPLVIRTDRDKKSFDRYVADIYSAEGEKLASALIEAGHIEVQ